MTGRSTTTATVLLVIGGLWIFLTGACCEAVFRGMRGGGKLQLELLLTLPGGVLVLAGLALLTPRRVAGLLVLAYAALLSTVWTQALFSAPPSGQNVRLTLLALFNTPSALLVVWGLVLLLKRGDEPTS